MSEGSNRKQYDQFQLRFPDGMRDRIAARAKENGRSMNAEIVQILADALDGGPHVIVEFAGKEAARLWRFLEQNGLLDPELDDEPKGSD